MIHKCLRSSYYTDFYVTLNLTDFINIKKLLSPILSVKLNPNPSHTNLANPTTPLNYISSSFLPFTTEFLGN